MKRMHPLIIGTWWLSVVCVTAQEILYSQSLSIKTSMASASRKMVKSSCIITHTSNTHPPPWTYQHCNPMISFFLTPLPTFINSINWSGCTAWPSELSDFIGTLELWGEVQQDFSPQSHSIVKQNKTTQNRRQRFPLQTVSIQSSSLLHLWRSRSRRCSQTNKESPCRNAH